MTVATRRCHFLKRRAITQLLILLSPTVCYKCSHYRHSIDLLMLEVTWNYKDEWWDSGKERKRAAHSSRLSNSSRYMHTPQHTSPHPDLSCSTRGGQFMYLQTPMDALTYVLMLALNIAGFTWPSPSQQKVLPRFTKCSRSLQHGRVVRQNTSLVQHCSKRWIHNDTE